MANKYQDDSDPDGKLCQVFMDSCNSVLERELSAYRFVGGRITEITSKQEISEIEGSLGLTGILAPVSNHLKRALDLYSDRKNPDYRNSIKESISAVEAICKIITKEPKTTLGKALDMIDGKSKLTLHVSLRDAFQPLYAYTSDAEGIRHALMDDPTLGSEDAKFMLVSCSAFVSYLVTKSSKTGIL